MKLMQIWINLILVAITAGYELSYCSSENTGTFAFQSIYQSNGLCHDSCVGQGYALAILQNENCYCSNYLPSNQLPLGSCSVPCPGYPSDLCGGDGVFGYLVIGAVSGTTSETSSAVSSSSESSSSSETSSKSTTTLLSSSSSSSHSSSSRSSSARSSPAQASSSQASSSQVSSSQASSSQASSSQASSSQASHKSLHSSHSTTPSANSTSTSSKKKTTSPNVSATSLTSSSNSAVITQVPVKITSIIYLSTTIQNVDTSVIFTQIQSTLTVSTISGQPTTNASSKSDSKSTTNRDSFFDHKSRVGGVFFIVGLFGLLLVLAVVYLIWFFFFKNRTHKDDEIPPEKMIVNDEEGSFHSVDTIVQSNAQAINSPTGVAIPGARPPTFVDQRLDHNSFVNTNQTSESLADNKDYSRRVLRVTNPE